MADTVKILGQTGGDDYSTVAAMLAAIPANIVTQGGDNWVIQVRDDATYPGFSLPTATTDATHKIIFEAFAGDEVDGIGSGAGFEGSSGGFSGFIATVVATTNDSHILFKNLKIKCTGGAQNTLFFDDSLNKEFDGCFIDSVSGGDTAIECANGGVYGLTFTNCIVASGANDATYWNSINSSSSVDIDGLTLVGTGSVGLDDRNFGNASSITARNVFSYGYSECFDNKLDQSDADYLASSDSTATSEDGGNGFNSRTTADFEDFAGGNYNLASGSSLVGAGEGGADIGATLGAGGGGGGVTARPSPLQILDNQYAVYAAVRLNGVLQ